MLHMGSISEDNNNSNGSSGVQWSPLNTNTEILDKPNTFL